MHKDSLKQETLAEYREKFREDGTTSKAEMKLHFESFLSHSLDKVEASLLSRLKERVEKVIEQHNARILNQFQLQGKADMPMIAYDERVCLVPAMEIATKETLSFLQEEGLEKVELNEWQDKDGIIRRGGIS